MVAQGWPIKQIAKELGVSVSTASHDVAAVKQIWADRMKEDIDLVRGQAIAEYQWLYKEAVDCWLYSKTTGIPSDRMLTAAGTFLEKRNKLLGLGLDLSVVQNNLNVHGEATIQQVSDVFSPMDPRDYAAFIEEKGPMTSLPPIPGKDDEEAIHDPGTAIHDTPEPDTNTWGVSAN